MGERGYTPSLWLCYSHGPRCREEHILEIRRCIPIIEDIMVDRGKNILVIPPAAAAGESQNVTEHFYLPLVVPTRL
jgi:hypothetical protein